MPILSTLSDRVDRLSNLQVFVLASIGVLAVGAVDYLTGYEISMFLFYLAPVGLAAWYAGREIGVAVAALSCVMWYVTDLAAGHQYSHPAIPVWNALVRFGFFLVTGLLLTALRRSLLAQQQLARTDDLTGLLSRRAFAERLNHDLVLSRRRNSALTLVYVDVDDFKAVNDAHGHAQGDRVLRAIGHALQRSVREGDTAARVGGDEFALVLPDTGQQGARQVVLKLRRALNELLDASDWGITCSIGVVTVADVASSPEDAVAAADALMYAVKRQGKGAVAYNVLGEDVAPRAVAGA